MAKSKTKGQKKPGRNKTVPANKRYLGEQRWIKNKRLRIERHQKRMAKKKECE